MRPKIIIGMCLLGMMGALSACGSTGLLDRNRPDEFAVTRGAPFKIPAEFTLPAPTPNAPDASQVDSKTQVLDAMFGASTPGQ